MSASSPEARVAIAGASQVHARLILVSLDETRDPALGDGEGNGHATHDGEDGPTHHRPESIHRYPRKTSKNHPSGAIPVGDADVLRKIGLGAGLDRDVVGDALGNEQLKQPVETIERQSTEMQIAGVPFFIVDRQRAISSAQPTEHWLAALRAA